MKIVVLADNCVAARPVRGEHGLAFWLEAGDRRLLFDAGQGLVLAENAQALGLDLAAVDTLVLSHGHYDHTGGVAEVLRRGAGPVAVHAHPDALLPRYKHEAGTARDLGMPAECREALRGARVRFAPSREPVLVAPGIRTTGEIRRRYAQEAIEEPFCLDPGGRRPDPLADDLALLVETAQGTVVLLGCAHAGLIATLDHVRQLTAGAPIRAIIGGMHLGSASRDRMSWTLGELQRFRAGLVCPLHCTGQGAAAQLWAAFPDACRAGGAGTVFDV